MAIQVSPRQQALLQQRRRRHTADPCRVRRASLLLAPAADRRGEVVAQQQGRNRRTVRPWRDRWLRAGPALGQAAPDQTTPPPLLVLLTQVPGDAPRPGTPATFTPGPMAQIIAVACEPPEKSGRPISHWAAHELADDVTKRRRVQAISARTVGRFLKGGRPPTASQPPWAQRPPRGP